MQEATSGLAGISNSTLYVFPVTKSSGATVIVKELPVPKIVLGASERYHFTVIPFMLGKERVACCPVQ